MTPKASTPAGRGTRTQTAGGPGSGGSGSGGAGSGGSISVGAGHRLRRTLRQPPGPRAPRRVSGPVGGRHAVTAASAAGYGAGGVAIPVPGLAPRGRRAGRARTGRARAGMPLGVRALDFVRGLPDHRLLDRAVRGRAWIPILGVMLAGIVAMQVEVLKLGASMGRSIERGSALQSRNELLRASVATLADDQRIERLAAAMGMVMPAPTGVGFINARHTSVQRAVDSIHAPDPTTFLTQLAAAQAAQAGPSAPATSTGTPTTGTVAPTGVGSPAMAIPGTTPSAPITPASATSTSTGAPATGTSTTGGASATGG